MKFKILEIFQDNDFIHDIKNSLERYEDEGNITINDLVDEVKNLAEDSDSPLADKLLDAAEKFKEELEDDWKFSGRGDMDSAEEEFIRILKTNINENHK